MLRANPSRGIEFPQAYSAAPALSGRRGLGAGRLA
jgi:hypothetical protein